MKKSSDDIKIDYTWKFQDFTARYIINIEYYDSVFFTCWLYLL